MTPLGALRNTKWEHWRESLLLTLFTVGAGLSPVWIGWILMKVYNQNPSLAGFAHNGDFAIYSAAMVAPIIYLIVKEHQVPFASRAIYTLISVVILVFAVAAYAVVAPVTVGIAPDLRPDMAFLAPVTFWAYVLSVLLALLVTALDNARMFPDVRAITERQQKDLEKKFDGLGGKDGQ
jgi:hypothetical protein